MTTTPQRQLSGAHQIAYALQQHYLNELGAYSLEQIHAVVDAAIDEFAGPQSITDEEIDRIGTLTEKAMEDGLRGFMKTWGWQQFARMLVDNLRPYGLRRATSAHGQAESK